MKRLVLTTVAMFALGSIATAQVIDFEPPVYSVGPVADQWFGVDTGKDFVGQGNWSDSISTSGGFINVYPDSGLYTGNQALDTNSNPSTRYAGANRDGLTVLRDEQPYYIQAGFDFFIGVPGSEASAGFWVDRNIDSLFDAGENTFHVGAFTAGSLLTPSAFGVRTANGLTYYSDGIGGVTTDINQAVQVQDLGWNNAQFLLTFDGSDFNLEVTIQHLSAGINEGALVDFNALNPGADPFSLTLTPDELGLDRISLNDCLSLEPDGLFANVFRYGALDNFTATWSCICVPEASSICLMGFATIGLGLAGRRKWASRRRK